MVPEKNLSSLTEIGVGRFKQWWKPENSCSTFSFFKLVGVSNSERNLVTGWRDLKKCPFTCFTWSYLRADTDFQKFHLRKLHQCDWGIFYSDAKCMSRDIPLQRCTFCALMCFLFKMTCTHTLTACNSIEKMQAVETFTCGPWWPLPPWQQGFVPHCFNREVWRGQGS